MSDSTEFKLASQMPNPRPLFMGKADLQHMAEMLLHRVGDTYKEDPQHLLDQAVLAHFRDGERLNQLRKWIRGNILELIPKNRRPDVDEDALERLVDEEAHAQGALFESMTRHIDGQLLVIGLARWALSAYATVQMPHTYAAGLIATNLPYEVADEIQPPFEGFLIEIPDGLLSVDNENGPPLPLRRVCVTKMYNSVIKRLGWAYIAMTDSVMSFWRFGLTTEDMLGEHDWRKDFPDNPTENPFAQPVTNRDARVSNCLGRLILNTCLAMSDPDNVRKVGTGHKAHADAHRRRVPGPPIVSTYVVGRPLKHDVREAVRIYIEEGREHRHLNVQTLVAGHWKWQAYGTGHLLRRRQWIEPYWRGPEDAPIVQRPHVLLGKKENPT